MALGRQHCRPGCIYSLRPAGIKVRINGSFILFSLQGAGIYVLVPRGLGRGGAILSGRAFKIQKNLCAVLSQTTSGKACAHDKRTKCEKERPERAASS